MKNITYYCVKCGAVIAIEYPRQTIYGRIVRQGNARLIQQPRMAPVVECRCGHRTVILKGEAA